MKRILSFLLALVLTFSMIPNVFAQEDIPGIDYDDINVGDFIYEVAEGEATITGYDGKGGNIMLPSELGGYPVTKIWQGAFALNAALTAVAIPESVGLIGEGAFNQCTNLQTVSFGSGISSIGYAAFYGCTALTDVYYDGTPEQWGAVEVGEENECLLGAAVHCLAGACGENLTWKLDGEGVLTISGEGAMDDFESYHAPWSDYYEQITAVSIGSGVTTIGDNAFYFLPYVSQVAVPEGVTRIGEFAFASCYGLRSVTVPASVTEIGRRAFSDNLCLGSIGVDENNAVYSSDEKGVLFNKDKTLLIQAPGDLSGTYTIPATVTAIADYAFEDCYADAVVFPNGLKTIGRNAFNSCDNLTAVALPNSVTEIGYKSFSNMECLSEVTLSGGLTVIPEAAFYGNHCLTSVVIPEGVQTIGPAAFAGCTGLEQVTIPVSVTKIETYGFGVPALQAVNYIGTSAQWSSIAIAEGNEALLEANIICEGDHTHSYTKKVTKPTCTEKGYTTYICTCGDSYKADYVNAKGHTYSKGKCTVCGYKPTGAKITSQPVNVAVANGKTAKVTVKASGTGLKYVWYMAKKGSSKFTKTTVTSSSYSVKMSSSVNGQKVYCQITDSYGNVIKSSTVTLYKGTPAKITTQPKSITVVNGKTGKLTIKASGSSLKYQWYVKYKGASSFTKVGKSSKTYSFKMASKFSGAQAYCVVKDKYGIEVKSSVVTIKLAPVPKITTQPESIAEVNGKTVKFSVKASGEGLKYQWYYAKKGSNSFKKLSGKTSATYSVKVSSSVSGRKYYCKVTDKYGQTVKSSQVTLTLKTVAKITTQPKGVTVVGGSTAKLTVKAVGDGAKYTWYYLKKGETKYTKASATGTSYSVKMSDKYNGAKVYCAVSDKYGNTVKSTVVTIKQAPKPEITTQPKNVLEVSGKTVKFSVKASGEGLKYQWYYAKKGSSSFKKLSGKTSATYSVKVSSSVNGRKYYCLVTDKYGQTVKSSQVTLTLKTVAKITTQPKSVTVSSGKTAKFTVKAVGDGVDYVWFVRWPNSDWELLTWSTNTISFKTSKDMNGLLFMCCAVDKYENVAMSKEAKLKVK